MFLIKSALELVESAPFEKLGQRAVRELTAWGEPSASFYVLEIEGGKVTRRVGAGRTKRAQKRTKRGVRGCVDKLIQLAQAVVRKPEVADFSAPEMVGVARFELAASTSRT